MGVYAFYLGLYAFFLLYAFSVFVVVGVVVPKEILLIMVVLHLVDHLVHQV
jgi:hypothetical protein